MVPTMVDSIMLVGALTHCAFLHSVHDLKTTQVNLQHLETYALQIQTES